jgi:negative regulator of sigma E activity
MTTGLNPPEPTGSESIDSDRVNFRQESERERHFHREQLSAMMDGTLSTDESRFLLRRMQHDAELAGSWERWQLYGDAMRGQTGNALPADFSRRVARAIAAEAEADRAVQSAAFEPAAATSGAAVAWRQRLRWGGGAALAASVAIAALISTRDLGQGGDAMPSLEVASAPSVVAPSTSLPAAGSPSAAAVSTAAAETVAISPDKIPRRMASIAAVSSESQQAVPASQMPQIGPAVRVATVDASPRSRRDVRPSLRTSGARVARSEMPATQAASASAAIDPFGRQGLDLNTKPWPRALLPESAGVGGVTVDYSVGSHGVHPSFQPRVETTLAPAQDEAMPPADPSPSP